MTSQINRVSAEQVDRALCQWGQWAARPQFWQDLRVAQLLKVYSIGLGGGGDISHRIRLDPQSQAMHRAYHQLQDEKVKVVLYLYYVVGVNFDGLKDKERALLKMGRSSFYRRLNTGSRMLYNRGMSILSSNKKTLDKNSVI